jgi:hypothetical protein
LSSSSNSAASRIGDKACACVAIRFDESWKGMAVSSGRGVRGRKEREGETEREGE